MRRLDCGKCGVKPNLYSSNSILTRLILDFDLNPMPCAGSGDGGQFLRAGAVGGICGPKSAPDCDVGWLLLKCLANEHTDGFLVQ